MTVEVRGLEDENENEKDGIFFFFLLHLSLAFPFACACDGESYGCPFFIKVGEHCTRRHLGAASLSEDIRELLPSLSLDSARCVAYSWIWP